jgi:hypothetical protein
LVGTLGEEAVVENRVLAVVPAALQAAAGIITAQAGHLMSPAGTPGTPGDMVPSESAEAAAAAFGDAFGGFCDGFSQRLSTASAALTDAADAFTAMEDTHRAALTAVATWV